MNPWKVILATMVIFACGVITGGVLTRAAATKPEPAASAQPAAAGRAAGPPMFQMQRANFLKVLNKQLDLSVEQREQIAKIMKASQERTQPLWNEISPQMKEEIRRVREEIRATLAPEQRVKFAELLKRNRKEESAPGSARPLRPGESATSVTNPL
ncbi:MAG TPA: hypothetical protein VGO59_13755 [Verrucomicrobiae bacterium]